MKRGEENNISMENVDNVSGVPARHAPDEVTDAMNRVCDRLVSDTDNSSIVASRQTLEKVEW